MSGNHFDKHTASLFTQITEVARKLTCYDVKTIKSTERRVSATSLFTQNTTLLENLLPMLFKQSSQRIEDCQVVIFDTCIDTISKFFTQNICMPH